MCVSGCDSQGVKSLWDALLCVSEGGLSTHLSALQAAQPGKNQFLSVAVL